MTPNLGRELFAIGAINRLQLFEHGCHIKTRAHDTFAKWDEIGRVIRHGHKKSLNGFTFSQKLGLNFEMRDGRTIQIEFTQFAFLWGLEFIYHNYKVEKLFEVLSQHNVPIR